MKKLFSFTMAARSFALIVGQAHSSAFRKVSKATAKQKESNNRLRELYEI